LPDASTFTPVGSFIVALVAATPLPVQPDVPVPAIVEILPLLGIEIWAEPRLAVRRQQTSIKAQLANENTGAPV
jgi:hypothetical protein